MATTMTPGWTSYTRLPGSIIGSPWKAWLLDRRSLTRRLITASQGQFAVKLISQRRDRPEVDECQLLGMGQGAWALIRLAELHCHGQPVVIARSVIPLPTISGPRRLLGSLGNRPLGAYLFRYPGMRRDPLQVGKVQIDQPSGPVTAWGRRSVFRLDGYPLLVSEIFLPAIHRLNV